MRRVVGGVTYTCRSVKNAQVLSNELEQMSWLSSVQKIDRLGIIVAKLACECVGGKDVGHKTGLVHRCQKDIVKKIKDEAVEGVGRKDCGGGSWRVDHG